MRKCVSCGVNNIRVEFNGIQCLECYGNGVVVYGEVIKKHKGLVYRSGGEKIKIGPRVCRRCSGVIESGKRICGVCLIKRRSCKVCGGDVKFSRQICDDCKVVKRSKPCNGCGGVRERYKRLCKVCLKPEIKKCRICGDIETSWKPFKINKNGIVLNRHICCSGIKVKVKKVKEIRSVEVLEDRVCNGCGDKKSVNEFYFNKIGYKISYYGKCKDCHRLVCKNWLINNKEKDLEYHREYNRRYKKHLPRGSRVQPLGDEGSISNKKV